MRQTFEYEVDTGGCGAQGEALTVEEPDAPAPALKLCFGPGCDQDCPFDKLKLCNTCRVASYCGIECQTKHWPEHYRNCNEALSEGVKAALTPVSNPLSQLKGLCTFTQRSPSMEQVRDV